VPHADEFAALCITLAHFDLTTTLACVLERHAAAKKDRLPFGPRDHDDFRELLLSPELLHSVATPEQVPLAEIIDRVLTYDFARAGDTDLGWYAFPDKPPRTAKLTLQAFLASRAARNPLDVQLFMWNNYKTAFEL
jgi:hypothetical protein